MPTLPLSRALRATLLASAGLVAIGAPSASAADVVVPGHGRPVDLGFVTRQRDDIAAVAAVVRERRLAGGSLAEALRDADPRLPYPLPDLESAIRRGWEHLTPLAP